MSRWNSPRFVETVWSGGQTTVVKLFDANPWWKKPGTKTNVATSRQLFFLCNHAARQLFWKLIFVKRTGWPSPFTSSSTYNIRKGCGKSAVSKLGTNGGLESTLGSSAKVMSLPRWNFKTDQTSSNIISTVPHANIQFIIFHPYASKTFTCTKLYSSCFFSRSLYSNCFDVLSISLWFVFFSMAFQDNKNSPPKLLAKTVGRLEVSCSQEVRQLSRPTYDAATLPLIGW